MDEVGGMGILQHKDLSAMHHAKHVYILKVLTSFYQINLSLHHISNVRPNGHFCDFWRHIQHRPEMEGNTHICTKISADLLLRNQIGPRWIITLLDQECSFNVVHAT